jgi:hypothetical protein
MIEASLAHKWVTWRSSVPPSKECPAFAARFHLSHYGSDCLNPELRLGRGWTKLTREKRSTPEFIWCADSTTSSKKYAAALPTSMIHFIVPPRPTTPTIAERSCRDTGRTRKMQI